MANDGANLCKCIACSPGEGAEPCERPNWPTCRDSRQNNKYKIKNKRKGTDGKKKERKIDKEEKKKNPLRQDAIPSLPGKESGRTYGGAPHK